MNQTINIVRLRQPDEFDATLRSVLRSLTLAFACTGGGDGGRGSPCRKTAALREKLVADDMPTGAINSVKAPAGLDLGAITPEEIALSILAEVTTVRWRGQFHSAPSEVAKA